MYKIKKNLLKTVSIVVFGISIVVVLLFFYALQRPPKAIVEKREYEPFVPFCGTKNSSSIGKAIFSINCAACHKLNGFNDIILQQYATYSDTLYFENYVRHEDSLVTTNKTRVSNPMHDSDFTHNFDFLSPKDMSELKIYIDSFLLN
ncbi:c-type cytochrome [Flavobacterium sp. GCM10023249]|uniref:c-type cytochrome n=1 Tax=unclassified Flavobacterium TaxID=196869 RepID=UPI0036102841